MNSRSKLFFDKHYEEVGRATVRAQEDLEKNLVRSKDVFDYLEGASDAMLADVEHTLRGMSTLGYIEREEDFPSDSYDISDFDESAYEELVQSYNDENI